MALVRDLGALQRHNGNAKRRVPALWVVAALPWMGCAPRASGDEPPLLSATVQVQNADGAPVPGATLFFDQQRTELLARTSDAQGRIELGGLAGPQTAVVDAPGYMAEPVSIGWGDGEKPRVITLHPKSNAKRLTMHFGGDAMFGRRYETPTRSTAKIPVHDPANGSTRVVRNLRHAFSHADFRTLNLETVIGNLPERDAYPGKRFLLTARPQSLAAVKSLGVDLVTLANNHSRDWLDLGVQSTILALQQAKIPFVGAATTQEAAEAPKIVEVQGTRVAVFSYTTVTGSFVNNKYPDAKAPQPARVAAKDRWMYEPRDWGFESAEWSVPLGPRRIGEAWRMFKAKERSLSADVVAKAWASLDAVYPELQDWVARRGHGGAAMWRTKAATKAIQETRAKADIVIVQLHAGFQFQAAPSTSVKTRARAAIDAGADLVVAHHPHVLQGFEWYKGKLIAYSLGNFIFDQDFLSTFPSGFLRTVWEGSALIEARFVPTVLVDYEPTPVTDQTARHVLRNVWAKSRLPAAALRDKGGKVKVVLEERDAYSAPADLVMEGGTARITVNAPSRAEQMRLEPNSTQPLTKEALVQSDLGRGGAAANSVLVGRDLFQYGSFEDEMADDRASGNLHWNLNPKNAAISYDRAKHGQSFLRVRKWSGSKSEIMVRPIARVPLLARRFWRAQGDSHAPADSLPTYTIQLSARTSKPTPLSLVIDVYHFDDTNPTEDPESKKLERIRLPFRVKPGAWQDVELELVLQGMGILEKGPNMIMPYIAIGAPSSGTSRVDIDEFRVMEWRDTSQLPSFFDAYDQVRNATEAPIDLRFSSLHGGSN